MKQYFLYFLNIILILLLFSCNENNPTPYEKTPYGDHTRIEGKVLEYYTGKPMVNCLVELQESFYAPLSGGGTFYPIDTIYADENGFYYFDFQHIKHTSEYFFTYRAQAKKQDYLKNENYVESGYTEINRNIIIQHYGWLRLHIKNINSFDENDFCQIITAGCRFSYFGTKVDTYKTGLEFGYQSNLYSIYVKKDDKVLFKQDSIFVPGHDTVDLNIFY